VSLKRVDGPAGPPWDPPLRGRLDYLVVESQALRGNPLGDPHRRPLYVYRPPGADGELPVVYLLHAFGQRADVLVEPQGYDPRLIDRIDELFSKAEVPPALVVVPDGWTRFGGSQWIDSAGSGRYLEYLAEEIVPFVDAEYDTSGQRAVTGHSSGGYGALVAALLRPDIFSAVGAHAPDSLFEHVFMRDFPDAARQLRDRFDGSWDVFLKSFETREAFDFGSFGLPVMLYAMACCYSPGPDGSPEFPFEIPTGKVIDDVWERWLAWDPTRLLELHVDSLKSMTTIYLEAGRSDEHYLDLGTHALARHLDQAGIEHEFVLFDGRHGGNKHRLMLSIEKLARGLAR